MNRGITMKNKTKSILNAIGLAYLIGFTFVIGITFVTALMSPNNAVLVTIDSYNEATPEIIFMLTGIIPMGYFIYNSIEQSRGLWFKGD
jgi:hypothetical protein